MAGQLHYRDGNGRDHDIQPPAFSELEYPVRTTPIPTGTTRTTDIEAGALPPLKTDFDHRPGTGNSRRQTANTTTKGVGFGRRATGEVWGESRERLEIREGQDASMSMSSGGGGEGEASRSVDGMTAMTTDDPFGSPTLTLPSYTFTAPQHSFLNAHLQNPLPSTNWGHSGVRVGGDIDAQSLSLPNEPPPPNPFSSPTSTPHGGSPVVPSPSNIPSPQATIASAVNWNSPSQSSPAHAFANSYSGPQTPQTPAQIQPRVAPIRLEPNRRQPEPETSTLKKKSSVDRLLMIQKKSSTPAAREDIEMTESPSNSSRPQGFGFGREWTTDVERGVSRPGTGTGSGSGSGSGSRSQSALGSLLLTEGNLEKHNTDGSSTTLAAVGITKPNSPLVPNRRQSEEPAATSTHTSRSKAKSREPKERMGRERDMVRTRNRDGNRVREREEADVVSRERESLHFVAGFKSPIGTLRSSFESQSYFLVLG